MGEDGDDGLGEDELGAREEHDAEEGRAAHGPLGVVEEAEDARVVQLVRVLADEKVACEKDRQGQRRSARRSLRRRGEDAP